MAKEEKFEDKLKELEKMELFRCLIGRVHSFYSLDRCCKMCYNVM